MPRHLHTPSENKEALQALSKTNKCAYVKDQDNKAHDSDDQEIEFKRYTNIITVTKSIRNRENMSLPQNDSVYSSPESKHVKTEFLTYVYKPGLLCPQQTMWTPLNDSGIVAESSLSIIDTNSENDVVEKKKTEKIYHLVLTPSSRLLLNRCIKKR